MVSDIGMKPFFREICVLLFGPLFNFLAALFYYFSADINAFSINLSLGLFNLLPFSSLDGGSIIEKMLGFVGVEAGNYMRVISVLSAAAIIFFFAVSGTGNITGYMTLILLAIYEFQ